MIPRLKAALGWAELRAALSINRPDDISIFEQSFAKLATQKHAVAFPYGRTALVAILKALDLENDEIICPSYTCVVVPHAIVTSNNIPVFVDSDPIDFNMDFELLKKAINEKTRAIICTSIFGYPVDLDKLNDIRKQFPNIIIIQDCAHSFFCQWNKEYVNKQGICAFYGLNISKIITSIFGGVVTTDSDEFSEKLIKERSRLLKPASFFKSFKRFSYLLATYVAFNRVVYGIINRMERYGFLDRFVKYYDPSKIDMPDDYLQSMTNLEARVGTAQCKHYHQIVRHRQKIAHLYSHGITHTDEIQLPLWHPGSTYSHFVVRTDKAVQIIEALLINGIQLGELIDYYIPKMPAYRSFKAFDDGNTSKWPGRVINLPVHMEIRPQDAKNIIRLINSIIL
jgi:perosamine synthetase